MRVRDNRGFSLVELIVAFAIFAIVGVAICSFVTFSSKTYSRGNKEVKLQYEQQMAVNNIRDVILETSRAISYNESTQSMIVFSDEPDKTVDSEGKLVKPPYVVSKIYLNTTENKLYYVTVNLDTLPDNMADISFTSAGGIIADNVKSFKVSTADVKDKGEVDVDITFEISDKKVESHSIVSLRNAITVAEDGKLNQIYDGDVTLSSPVKAIYITRDGTVFRQGATDSITMVKSDGGIIKGAAQYIAKVTAKKYMEEDVSQGATWNFGNGQTYYADASGNHVIEVNATGLVTINGKYDDDGNNTALQALKDAGVDHIILVATSIADPSKSARIKITLTGKGIYPTKITTAYKEVDDTVYGQKDYVLTHTINYEGVDPGTGDENPTVTGDAAYELVTYSVTENGSAAEIPIGAGFLTVNNKTDKTKFVATKSMEGHTYTIRTTVNQRDKEGKEVYSEITITVSNVPDAHDTTKPVLAAPETADRGAACSVGVSWSDGAPKYKDSTTGKEKNYYYRFNWKVDNLNNDCGNWGTGTTNSFDNLIGWDSSTNKETTSEQTTRIKSLWIQSKLNWKQSFTIRVTVTPEISKDKNTWETYGQSASKVITIKPVELTLELVDQKINYNGYPLSGIFSTSTIIDVTDKMSQSDKKTYLNINDDYNLRMNLVEGGEWSKGLTSGRQYQYDVYKRENGRFDRWSTDANSHQESDGTYTEYHNIRRYVFRPTFKYLSVNALNYYSNIDSIRSSVDTNGDGKDDSKACALYYMSNGNTVPVTNYPNNYEKTYTSDIMTANNKVYFLLTLHPVWWNELETYPSECVYRCVVKDSYENSVQGTFSDGASYLKFTLKSGK